MKFRVGHPAYKTGANANPVVLGSFEAAVSELVRRGAHIVHAEYAVERASGGSLGTCRAGVSGYDVVEVGAA